jgi:putative flippase GtrA
MNTILAWLRTKQTFLTYCAIGLAGVGIDFIVYSLLLRLSIVSYQVANAMGYLGGTLLSFALNSRYNFRISDKLGRRFALFLSVGLLGYATSVVALHGLIERAGFDPYLSKVATLIAVVPIQYNVNRLISFRKSA